MSWIEHRQEIEVEIAECYSQIEELTDILYDALDTVVPVENALSFESIKKVAKILYDKGWREVR